MSSPRLHYTHVIRYKRGGTPVMTTDMSHIILHLFLADLFHKDPPSQHSFNSLSRVLLVTPILVLPTATEVVAEVAGLAALPRVLEPAAEADPKAALL